MAIDIIKQRDYLNNLFVQVNEIDNLEMKSHWAKYLCILVSGFIETSTRLLLMQYAENTSSPNVANYVSRQLRRYQNIKSERLLQLFGAFSPEWRKELEGHVDEETKNAIDSIVANRNNIAHGEKLVGVTIIQIQGWYKKSLNLFSFIEEKLIS